MLNDTSTTEYLMNMPLPVVIIEKRSGKVAYVNEQAKNNGILEGVNFYDLYCDRTEINAINAKEDKPVRKVCLSIEQKIMQAEMCESDVKYDGKAARLIAITSMHEKTDQMVSEWSICRIFAEGRKRDGTQEFLRMTGQNEGAFCAALYENNRTRYVLKNEWRSRKSVSIPVLRADFLLHIESESAKLLNMKQAVDLVVLPYTKTYGTKGIAIYFFDKQANTKTRERIRRYIGLYQSFSGDVPTGHHRMTLHKAVNTLEQGFAVWNEATRALLYCNKAYRSAFGQKNQRTISDILGKGIVGRVSRESCTDGHGRYFDVTHTSCGNKGKNIVSTIIIDNTAYVKAQRKLDMMARTDALTGLMNRRAGLEQLTGLYETCKNKKLPLTVCFADIDGLKHINDTWGHGAGDAMIQSVAGVLKRHVNDIGSVCRLGGDEFVLILPGITFSQATLLATRIGMEAAHNFVGESDGISLSFGFKQAEYVGGETAASLISVADTEMYREKRSKYIK